MDETFAGATVYVVGYCRCAQRRGPYHAVSEQVVHSVLSGTRRAFSALCDQRAMPGCEELMLHELPPDAPLCRTCRAVLVRTPPARLRRVCAELAPHVRFPSVQPATIEDGQRLYFIDALGMRWRVLDLRRAYAGPRVIRVGRRPPDDEAQFRIFVRPDGLQRRCSLGPCHAERFPTPSSLAKQLAEAEEVHSVQ
jgi:hypothetical protein